MIPKIIHYCWFGGNEIPAEYKSYIDDWKAFHPDWVIKLWDEKNAPEGSNYLRNSIKEKKWSNCSNFIRLYALQEYGGIYFDTDIKVIRAFDELINLKCFLGFESSNADSFVVNNAVMGAEPGHSFVAGCLEILESRFDGVEESDLSGPGLTTSVLKKEWGLKTYGNQLLNNEVTVFETEYFYPIHIHMAQNLQKFEQFVTTNTFAVHMWGRSWVSKEKLISIVDYLNFKTAEQDKYIVQLQNINNESESKANEIYFWKVHFEKEYNRIQEIYQQLLNERTEQNDLLRTDPFNNSIIKLFQLVENTNKEINEKIRVVENLIQSAASAINSSQDTFVLQNEKSLGNINEQLNELGKSKDKLEKLEAWLVEVEKNISVKENTINQTLRALPGETAQNITGLLGKKIQDEYLPIKEGHSK
ncbi:MAG TPA: glycosyltransferase, partial [Chitinophagaceae bacterium]